MCGRFALTHKTGQLEDEFAAAIEPFPPRYNIAPTQPIAIVRMERGRDGFLHRRFALVRWGLIPSWVKDVKAFPLIINARGEDMAARPSFRAAFRHRRCIIMADAFYEWQRVPGMKGRGAARPYLIRRRDGETMAFAGLWEDYLGPDGSQIETGCIVTTAANGLLSGLHDRMPAILERAQIGAWLDTQDTQPKAAAHLVRPAHDDVLEMIAIGPAVNKVANDGPEIQEPLGEAVAHDPSPRQGELF